jgi:hypothetical protein
MGVRAALVTLMLVTLTLVPLTLSAGCSSTDPWHGAVEVAQTARAVGAGEPGSCALPLESAPPEAPWLFVAVATDGLDDVVSLYWCDGPKDCGAPFGGALLSKLTETRLEAVDAIADTSLGCSIRWGEVVAEQTAAGHVSLDYRTGHRDLPGTPPEDCVELAPTSIGDYCDLVLHVEGDR